jgi:type IV secretory pathway TrbF-like protein
MFRRRPPAEHPEGERSADPYRSRYDIARQGYEMRVAQLARALDQATLKNYLSAAGNIVLAAGIVTIALRGGVRPVFIPYDQFGRVIRYEDMGRFMEPSRPFVEAQLFDWLVQVRGIYYGDPVAQMDRARAARAILSEEAERWLGEYYAAASRNPALLLNELSRTVEVISISRDPERKNRYSLQWREIDDRRRGPDAESVWQGTLVLGPVGRAVSEEALWNNPTRIQIQSIEWHQLRGWPPPTSPSSPPPPVTDPQVPTAAGR